MKKEIFYCDICGKEVPVVTQIAVPIVRTVKFVDTDIEAAYEFRKADVDACSDCAEEISKTVKKLCCDKSLARLYRED